MWLTVQAPHRRTGTPPAPPLRRNSPWREEGPAAADHGQDPAQVPAHRHALRQARRRGCRRGHQPARPPPAHTLNPAVTLRLADSSGSTSHAEQGERHRVYLMTAVLPTPLAPGMDGRAVEAAPASARAPALKHVGDAGARRAL